MRRQVVGEPVVVGQVVGAGLVHGFGHHLVDVEGDFAGLGVVEDLSLGVGEDGIGQVVEVQGLH